MKNLKRFTFIAVLPLVFFSCRKKKIDASTANTNHIKGQFIGSWLWNRVAFDYNHNNTIDDSELYTYPDTMGKALLIYHDNGSGEQKWVLRSDTSGGSSFQWEITDNGNRILLKNLFNVKSQYRLIKGLSAKEMTLADTGTVNGRFGTSWFLYTRR